MVAFDCVIIAMLDTRDEIQLWILDLCEDNKEYKWVESRLEGDEVPESSGGTSMILTNNGYLHFMNAWEETLTHFKIHLSSFLPTTIWKKYRNYRNDKSK